MSSYLQLLAVSLAVTCGGAALAVSGCGGDDPPPATSEDAGVDGTSVGLAQGCKGGAKECVSDRLARICPEDGASWLAVACGSSEKCIAGECKLNAAARCTPGSDGECLNENTGLRCKDDGSGYDVVNCPSGTACIGAGVCRGACTVGDATCLDVHTVQTCVDGKALRPRACAQGELCVALGNGRADCRPAQCTPDPVGCTPECGNRTDEAADPTRFISSCVATLAGYRWRATECGAGQTCNPTGGGTCGVTRGRATCSGTCTPGAQRCATATGLNGIQTCGPDGKWGTEITACNPEAVGGELQCMISPVDPLKALCGDRLCASGQVGTCEANGQIRRCGPDGRLMGPVACTAGRCQTTSTASFGGNQPGNCSTTCQPGDEICANSGVGNTFLTCVNGSWSAPVACPDTPEAGLAVCRAYTNTAGRPAKICGAQCAPGSHRCDDGGIQTCDGQGRWSTTAACRTGRCVGVGSSDAQCQADCVPGRVTCLGGNVETDVNNRFGAAASIICPASGILPSNVTCPGDPLCCAAGTTCRKSSSGQALGCVQCVGPTVTGGNEWSEVDSRCVGSDGGTGSNSVQVCGEANTWAGTTACPDGATCALVGGTSSPTATCR